MPAVTPLPTPPNSVSRVSTFSGDTDAFLAALQQFANELNAYTAGLSPIGRNMLINGGFDINQRAPASNADDSYSFDRWNILTQTGAVACTQLGPMIENGFNRALRITQSQATAQRFGFEQIVENVNCAHTQGNSVTLSGRVRCSVAGNIRYAILGWTGTTDVVTSDVVNNWASGTYTAGNFFLASNVAVLASGVQAVSANTWANLAAISGVVGSSNNVIALVWSESALAQNATLDCDFVQLEAGAAATPFEKRNIKLEQDLCYRYFRKFGNNDANDIFGTGQAVSTTAAMLVLSFDEMRAAPSATVLGSTDFRIQNANAGGYPTTTVVSVDSLTKKSARANFTTGGSLAAGSAAVVFGNTGVAGFLLDADM